MSAKLLFYVQSLWGIGHLSRTSAIASASCDAGFDVTLVHGGAPVPGIVEDRVRLIQLPPVKAFDETYAKLVTTSGAEIDDAFKRDRTTRLLASLDSKPDAVITETWPFGRRKLAFEIEPFIAAAKAAGALTLSSVRDILVPPTLAKRAAEAIARTREDFAAVLVHGDDQAIRLEESFPQAEHIQDCLRYTGYVVRKPPTTRSGERFDVLVSAGGGQSGTALISAALAASEKLDAKLTWLIVTGPLARPLSAPAPRNVTLATHRPDLAALMTRARVCVSQAGYNTVIEALSAGCRPILVPFSRSSEIEQVQRAARFADLGLATMVWPNELSSLGAVITRMLAEPQDPRPCPLRLDGAAESARIIQELLRARAR